MRIRVVAAIFLLLPACSSAGSSDPVKAAEPVAEATATPTTTTAAPTTTSAPTTTAVPIPDEPLYEEDQGDPPREYPEESASPALE